MQPIPTPGPRMGEQLLVGYHWSPATRRSSIHARGLLVGSRPVVNGVEDDHRNPWISLSPTPSQAWWLSGGAIACGGFHSECPTWDLWEVDLTDARAEYTDCGYPEVRVLHAISPTRMAWIASRQFSGADDPITRTPGGGSFSDRVRTWMRTFRLNGARRPTDTPGRPQHTHHR